MNKILLFSFFYLSFSYNLWSQGVGDIAITGVNTDNPDDFTFVAINTIAGGQAIYFTDSGINMDGSFRGNEGAIIYTTPVGGLAQGQVVYINITDLTTSDGSVVDGNDSNVGNNGMQLTADGDQIIAFTGSTASPTFIAALQTNSTVWQTGATSSSDSALPPGLTNGLNAVAVGNGAGAGDEFDNSEYIGARGSFTDINTARMTLNNNANWSGNNNPITLITTDFASLLPIELISFNAISKEKSMLISWQTASEFNNDYMAIERSTDSKDFQEIGMVQGAGTTYERQEYTFVDKSPVAGLNYYRLLQVDYDGTATYSKVVTANFRKNDGDIVMYPNPTANDLTIEFPENWENETVLTVFDFSGKNVLTKIINADATTMTLELNSLNAGIYSLTLANGNRFLQKNFVKN